MKHPRIFQHKKPPVTGAASVATTSKTVNGRNAKTLYVSPLELLVVVSGPIMLVLGLIKGSPALYLWTVLTFIVVVVWLEWRVRSMLRKI